MSFEKINESNRDRPEGNSCVLVYGYEDDIFQTINNYTVKTYDIEAKQISDDMLGATLEQIVENDYKKEKYNTGVKTKVIIFNALSDSEVHQFIDYIKTTDYNKPIYATVTETSKKWKFGDLMKELVKEKMMMAKHKRR